MYERLARIRTIVRGLSCGATGFVDRVVAVSPASCHQTMDEVRTGLEWNRCPAVRSTQRQELVAP